MKDKILIGALGLALLCGCHSSNTSSSYGGYGSNNAMATLPAQTQQLIISDIQSNPGLYQQRQGEDYNTYVIRMEHASSRWLTPEEYKYAEYRSAAASAAIQQAASMGLVNAKAQNLMWQEAVKTERAQAEIWDARADVQSSKRSINRDKVGTYKDTTRGVSDTVGGVSDTFKNTKSMIDNFNSIFD